MDLQNVWTACLGELRLQMTSANFSMWLKESEAVELSGGILVVAVGSAYARDWLENRLRALVERTLTGIVGTAMGVQFVVRAGGVQDFGELSRADAETLPADVVAVKFYNFDPKGDGWLQTSKYDIHYWQPLVGCVAFSVYQFLRCEEKLNSGWGSWFVVTVEEISATLGVGRQEITGVLRKRKGKGKYWQPGALDRLEEAAIAKIERLGEGKKISYRVSCLHSLPLLTPAQVETLDPILQRKHADFLRKVKLQEDEWLQLELPSLVQG